MKLHIPAPVNELQSIAAWLRESNDVEAMQNKMRNRMLLLMQQAQHLHNEGLEAELKAGIYDNRPDMKQEAIDRAMSEAALTNAVEISQEYKLP